MSTKLTKFILTGTDSVHFVNYGDRYALQFDAGQECLSIDFCEDGAVNLFISTDGGVNWNNVGRHSPD